VRGRIIAAWLISSVGFTFLLRVGWVAVVGVFLVAISTMLIMGGSDD